MQTHILHILYTRELSAAHDPTVGVETVASSYCDDFSKNKVAKLGGGFKRLFYIMYDIFMKSFFFFKWVVWHVLASPIFGVFIGPDRKYE